MKEIYQLFHTQDEQSSQESNGCHGLGGSITTPKRRMQLGSLILSLSNPKLIQFGYSHNISILNEDEK
jgi:hypothetical protein